MTESGNLVAIEKWTLGLAAALIGVAVLTLGGRTAFGVTMGAGLMAVNAWAIRRMGARLVKNARPSVAPGRRPAAALIFNLKMALLIGVVWVILRVLHVDPMGFIIGLSIFPAAILIVAVRQSFRAREGTQHG